MNKINISSINDFEPAIKGKRLILFGAGRALQGFFMNFAGKDFLTQVAYAVDNNKTIQHTVISVGSRDLRIESPEYLEKDVSKDIVIIVTNNLNPEIYIQLDNMPQLKDIQVYSGKELSELLIDEQLVNVQLQDSFKVYSEIQIPKVIHYCWFGGNPIPLQYKEWMASWKKFCPDYEIMEWNESNYDFRKNPYMEQAYKAGKWAFVSDYARLDIIYEHGGLYFDTDVELIKNMDDFLYQDGFGGYQPDRRFASGLGIGARKGLAVLKKFRDLYDDRNFVDFEKKSERWSKKIKITPDILTEYLSEHGYNYTNGIVDIDGFRIYPAPVLCGLIGQKLYLTDKTYAIHHFAGSWMPEK